jgi:hypothetical protein
MGSNTSFLQSSSRELYPVPSETAGLKGHACYSATTPSYDGHMRKLDAIILDQEKKRVMLYNKLVILAVAMVGSFLAAIGGIFVTEYYIRERECMDLKQLVEVQCEQSNVMRLWISVIFFVLSSVALLSSLCMWYVQKTIDKSISSV